MSFESVKSAWLKRVDTQLLQVAENMQSILQNCQVDSSTTTPLKVYREAFQLNLHAANIKSAVDNLLSLASEIRWTHLLENQEGSIVESVVQDER